MPFNELLLDGIKEIAKEIIKAAVERIGRTELYKKLERNFFPEEPNDFKAIYASALVELWYENQNPDIIDLFKEKSVAEAIYKKWYENSDDLKVSYAIQRAYDALIIGDRLKTVGISAEQATKVFIESFDQAIEKSRDLKEQQTKNTLHQIEKAIEDVPDKVWEVSKKMQVEKHLALVKKFDLPDSIDVIDVFRALCSDDETLLLYGAFYAGERRVIGTGPLLLAMLDSSDSKLIGIVIRSIGQLKYYEARETIITLFDSKDEATRKAAYGVYFIDLPLLNQDTLSRWVQWLHLKNQFVKQQVLYAFYYAAGDGRLDVASIENHLVEEMNNDDTLFREFIYRLLFHIQGISSRIDFVAILEREADNSIAALCVARILFAENLQSAVGAFVKRKISENKSNISKFDSIIALCSWSSDESCRRIYEELKGDDAYGYKLLLLRRQNEPYERSMARPNAMSMNRTGIQRRLLEENEALNKFFKFINEPGINSFSNRKTANAIAIDEDISAFDINGVAAYAVDVYHYYLIDFRSKSATDTANMLWGFGQSKKICLIICNS